MTHREKIWPISSIGARWRRCLIAHRPRIFAVWLHGCPRPVAPDALPAARRLPTATAATAHVSHGPSACRHSGRNCSQALVVQRHMLAGPACRGSPLCSELLGRSGGARATAVPVPLPLPSLRPHG